jgi:hypothetical protein
MAVRNALQRDQSFSPELLQVQRRPGQPLPGDVRATRERGIGHDFADVVLHDDAASRTLANELGARAFTIGSHVGFGAGEYDPRSSAGRSPIAHELVHVAQQRADAGLCVQCKSPGADAKTDTTHERMADQVAERVTRPPTFPVRFSRFNASYVSAELVDGRVVVRMPVQSYMNGRDLPGMHDMPPVGVIVGMSFAPDAPIVIRHYEPSLLPFKDDAVTERKGSARDLLTLSEEGDRAVLTNVALTAVDAVGFTPAGAVANRLLAAVIGRGVSLGRRWALRAALAVNMVVQPVTKRAGAAAAGVVKRVLPEAAARLEQVEAKVVVDGFKRARQIIAAKMVGLPSATALTTRGRAAFRKFATEMAANNPALQFLLHDGKLVSTVQRGMTQAWRIGDPTLVEAGHVASAKIGGETVILMSAWKNRMISATLEHKKLGGAIAEIPFALDFGGVLVDLELAVDWCAAGLLEEEALLEAVLVAL